MESLGVSSNAQKYTNVPNVNTSNVQDNFPTNPLFHKPTKPNQTQNHIGLPASLPTPTYTPASQNPFSTFILYLTIIHKNGACKFSFFIIWIPLILMMMMLLNFIFKYIRVR